VIGEVRAKYGGDGTQAKSGERRRRRWCASRAQQSAVRVDTRNQGVAPKSSTHTLRASGTGTGRSIFCDDGQSRAMLLDALPIPGGPHRIALLTITPNDAVKLKWALGNQRRGKGGHRHTSTRNLRSARHGRSCGRLCRWGRFQQLVFIFPIEEPHEPRFLLL
jgi:hypothetical protein